jgi:hypothetical protein
LQKISLNWIIDEVYPSDYDHYFGKNFEHNNRTSWLKLKVALIRNNLDDFYRIYNKVAVGDFSGYENSDPIKVVRMHDWNFLANGHHRVIAAWMLNKEFVEGIIE